MATCACKSLKQFLNSIVAYQFAALKPLDFHVLTNKMGIKHLR